MSLRPVRVCCTLAALFGLCATASAQQYQAPGNLPRPETKAYRLAVEPVLDGDVRNDPAWRDVQSFSDFVQVQPNQGAPASKKTEVFVGFTDTALWIGVIAHDESPDRIIVSEGFRLAIQMVKRSYRH